MGDGRFGLRGVSIIGDMGVELGATYGVIGSLVLWSVHDFRRHGGDHND